MILILSIICSTFISTNLGTLKEEFDDYDKIAALFPENSHRLLKSLIANGQIVEIFFDEKLTLF
jgi:hypothetical protein